MKRSLLYYLVRLVQSFVIAMFLNLSFYLSMSPCIPFNQGVYKDFGVYQNGFYILLLIVFPLSLLPYGSIGLVLFSLFCSVVSFINFYELTFRGTVLVLNDYKNLNTVNHVISSYKFSLNANVMVMIMSVVVTIGLCIVSDKIIPRKTQRSLLLTRIGVGVLDVIVLVYLLVSSSLIPTENMWSWEEYYYRYGFVVGMAGNIKHGQVTVIEPDGYNRNSIRLIDSFPPTTREYPDIIMILNETYYDFTHLMEMDTDVDFMENFKKLECFKGYAAVPVVGGGTNDSEYELLTGNSISLLNTYSPFNNLSLSSSNSIAGYLKELGYATMGAHSEVSSNYHRESSWEDLGLEQTWFDQAFEDLQYDGNRPRATDSSVFKNFSRLYEGMPSDKPRFGFLITIQNHGGWSDNPSEFDRVHVLSGDRTDELEEYLTSMQMTDAFIQELTEYFRGTDRKVIVCMVGDHAPAFIPQFNSGTDDDYLRKRQVPYFIWSNYIDTNEMPLSRNVDLCALSPYAMYCGGLPICPYHMNIINLSQTVQCFTNVTTPGEGEEYFGNTLGYVLSNGEIHSIDEDTEEGMLLRNYFYSEYNLLADRNKVKELTMTTK